MTSRATSITVRVVLDPPVLTQGRGAYTGTGRVTDYLLQGADVEFSDGRITVLGVDGVRLNRAGERVRRISTPFWLLDPSLRATLLATARAAIRRHAEPQSKGETP